MSEEEAQTSPERPVFHEFFQVMVPDILKPEKTIITIKTPREGDRVNFTIPEDQKGKSFKEVLKTGKSLAAKLIGQKEGDCIAISYTGIGVEETIGVSVTSSALDAYRYSSENGWEPLRGSVAFRLDESSGEGK